MKFMMIVKASEDSEAGKMPPAELLEAMGKFNQEMVAAGILRDAAGLKATSHGARIQFNGDDVTVEEGPFGDASSLWSGYWTIEVGSKAEAIEWARRSPNPHPGHAATIELRQFFEMADFA